MAALILVVLFIFNCFTFERTLEVDVKYALGFFKHKTI